jgi:acetyltransferase-like isoleucine patch superfamily enzyme
MKRSQVRALIAMGVAPMPMAVKRLALRWLLGAQIDKSARIGLSIVDCDSLVMGQGSCIGHLTVIKGLRRVRIGADAHVGNLNWISASPMFLPQATEMSEHGCFTLGRASAVTNRHYVDCSGGVVIGEHSSVAGVRSTFLSHQIDLAEGIQTAAPITIGDYCFLSSNVCLVAGASVPSRTAVAMGAVVVGQLEHSGALYGGVPARLLRSSVDRGKWFHRRLAFTGITSPELEDDPLDGSAT